MKLKSKDNVGGGKKQALPITEDEGNILWSSGDLGLESFCIQHSTSSDYILHYILDWNIGIYEDGIVPS
jgi:hypothetical protein